MSSKINFDFSTFRSGLLMGMADAVPGVSGGTIALILGIYNKLIFSLSEFLNFFKKQFPSKSYNKFIESFQFLFTLGLVAILSALCVFLRDLQQLVALSIMVWFFLTPIIYPLSLIESESIQSLFILNPMHNFVSLYREIILLGQLPYLNILIVFPDSMLSYLAGGWFFVRIKHAFGDVL